jgi:hypothetical protein
MELMMAAVKIAKAIGYIWAVLNAGKLSNNQ